MHTDPVDLRSDTVTRPTQGMRDAMARAEVGDDVFGEDPTINALERRVADLLGKERSLFVPSGTMANLLAFLSQTQPGDTVILNEDAHPFHYESGNLGMVASVMTRLVPGCCGTMTPDDIEPHIVQGKDHHRSPTTMISIENTTNRGGGNLYGLDVLEGIRALALERRLRVHCDGARIFNAVVETGVSVETYASLADTISFCFSKGLGAPVGSILAGDGETIEKAHRYRKMLGGGMRQAGVLAAAALYALDHHVERLKDDHDRAKRFRAALEGLPGVAFPLPSPTNMVYLEVDDAPAFTERLRRRNVLTLAIGPSRIRVVFHLDIADAGLERAIEAFSRAFDPQ